MSANSHPTALYTRLHRFGASKGALVGAFLWGLAEATVFFVVPDTYLGFVALFHWTQGLLAIPIAIFGALIGGALMYAFGMTHAEVAHQVLVHIPLISPEMVKTVVEQMQNAGLPSLVSAPFQGIPYKIYAVEAGRLHLHWMAFLVISVVARLERILPTTLCFAIAGRLLKKFVQWRTRIVAVAYWLFWLGVYAFYIAQVR